MYKGDVFFFLSERHFALVIKLKNNPLLVAVEFNFREVLKPIKSIIIYEKFTNLEPGTTEDGVTK